MASRDFSDGLERRLIAQNQRNRQIPYRSPAAGPDVAAKALALLAQIQSLLVKLFRNKRRHLIAD